METLPVHLAPAKISPPAQPPPRSDEAFSSLYREHRSFVRKVLLGRGVMEANADDLVQEVFTVVFRRGVFPPDDGQTKAYLWAIALRISSNHRMLKRHTQERIRGDVPEGAIEARMVERIEAARWSRRLVARLSPKLRGVFVAFVIEGRTIPDVAREYGIKVKTAAARIRLAREEMARWRRGPV